MRCLSAWAKLDIHAAVLPRFSLRTIIVESVLPPHSLNCLPERGIRVRSGGIPRHVSGKDNLSSCFPRNIFDEIVKAEVKKAFQLDDVQ
jgi:hypothetical protein